MSRPTRIQLVTEKLPVSLLPFLCWVIAALDDVPGEPQQREVGLGVPRKAVSLLIQISPATPTIRKSYTDSIHLNELVDSDNADAVICRAGQPLVVGPKFTATGGNGRRQVQSIGGLQAMAGAQLGG